jgi:putative ABC transport system permease protein
VRQGLVIFQYATAVILIAATLVIYRQLQFMQGQDLGFSLERTLVLNAPSVIRDDSLYQLRYRSFREALAIYPDIVNVASSSAIPGKNMYDLDTHGGLRLVGASEAEAATFSSMRVEPGFLETYGMRLAAGRAFSRDRKADQGGLILNETAAQVLGFTDPRDIIGKRIQYWQEQKEIIGVIQDYHHKSLRHVVEPLILRNDPHGHLYFSIKFSDTGQAAVERLVEQVRRSWERVYPDNPFHFFFLDDHFQEQYLADVQLGRVAALFSLLTIFIACLGLFGLASYTVSVRTREIGIRKVLGASATSIVLLLSRRYFHWLLLAFLIGVPAAYYLSRHWLQNFTSTISLSPWLFVLPCLLVLVIGLAAVSGQSLQAATRNPVDALRKE